MVSANEPPAEPQEAQHGSPKLPTQKELDARAEALKKKIEKRISDIDRTLLAN